MWKKLDLKKYIVVFLISLFLVMIFFVLRDWYTGQSRCSTTSEVSSIKDTPFTCEAEWYHLIYTPYAAKTEFSQESLTSKLKKGKELCLSKNNLCDDENKIDSYFFDDKIEFNLSIFKIKILDLGDRSVKIYLEKIEREHNLIKSIKNNVALIYSLIISLIASIIFEFTFNKNVKK